MKELPKWVTSNERVTTQRLPMSCHSEWVSRVNCQSMSISMSISMSCSSADKSADAFNLKSSKMLNLFFIYLQGSPGQLGRTGRRFESGASCSNEVVCIQLLDYRAGTHSNVIFECYLFKLVCEFSWKLQLTEQQYRTVRKNPLSTRSSKSRRCTYTVWASERTCHVLMACGFPPFLLRLASRTVPKFTVDSRYMQT